MIRTYIFWLIVAPTSLAFVLGLIASSAQAAADKITADSTKGDPV
ncbi:hypothetical protein [Leptolyngbya sp. FACHB-17]|nr:hypothetical protein [Leptolyngbya sp. FACHB-17]